MTSPTAGSESLCFPLDYPDLPSALAAAKQLAPHVGVFKVGLELFVREGPRAVSELRQLGSKIFLDLKLHDIPATVAGAVTSAGALQVDFLTVHASGGSRMLEAAQRAAAHSPSLQLLGVTVLTSTSEGELAETGVVSNAKDQVQRLAQLSAQAGLAGLVCSVEEVSELRTLLGPEMVLVTPGIRPRGSDVGDQRRVGTPQSAITAGSSLLVVGRPIRLAPDPAAAARAIALEIAAARSAQTPGVSA